MYRGKFGDLDIQNTCFKDTLHQKEESSQYIMLCNINHFDEGR